MAGGKAIPFEEKLKKAEETVEKPNADMMLQLRNEIGFSNTEMRKEELFEAVMNSDKSYEEIMAYLQSPPKDTSEKEKE